MYSMPTFMGHKCPVCSKLKAWDKDGKADPMGMAKYFLEKLIESENFRFCI